MPTFTYVTVSYCYVGVSYPRVGYADEGYRRVSYPVVGYGFVGVTHRYADGGYLTVGYGGVWRSEMWRRTHRQGLTAGAAVGRMEVQQGEREKGNPDGHRDRLLRRARRLLHRGPGGRPGRLRRLTRRPPLRRGPPPARRRPSEAREGPSERRRRPRLGHPAGRAPEALRGAISKPEAAPPKAGGVRSRARRRPRAITQRRCCENPGTWYVSFVSLSEIGTKVLARGTM